MNKKTRNELMLMRHRVKEIMDRLDIIQTHNEVGAMSVENGEIGRLRNELTEIGKKIVGLRWDK